MSKNMNPHILALLETERQVQKSFGVSQARRIKFDKDDDQWLVRFLPTRLGDSQAFFVRHGQHWCNKQPITCPRSVDTSFGGNPNASCPVCEFSDEVNNDPDTETAKRAWQVGCRLNYITYCLAFEVDTGRGQEKLPENEIMLPYEFSLSRQTFDELAKMYQRSASRAPDSILDVYKGNDFWAMRVKGKGILLDKQDSAPIFEMEEQELRDKMDVLIQSIRGPRIRIATDQEMEAFMRKCEAFVYDTPSSRTSRHGHSDDEGSRSARSRRHSAPPVDDPEPEAEAEQPEVQPARRAPAAVATRPAAAPARPAAAPAQRPAARPAVKQPEPEPEPEAEQPEAEQPEAEDDQIPGAEVPARPVARPTAAAPARPAAAPARPAVAAAPTRRPAAATVAAPVRRPAAPVTETVTEEEDPGVAEEVTDQAPPAEAGLDESETPPQPVTAPVTRTTAVASPGPSLRSKIASASGRR